MTLLFFHNQYMLLVAKLYYLQIGLCSLNDHVRCGTINFQRTQNNGIMFGVVQLVFKRIRIYRAFVN